MKTLSTYSVITDLFLIGLFAVGLFAALRISFVLINYLFAGIKFRQKLLRIFYFLQFVLWFTFILISFNSPSLQPLVYNPVFVTAVAVLLILFIITTGKDIFAGIVLRTDESLAINSSIKSSIASGRIIKLGLRSATLEPVNGEAIRVPYSQLASSSITISRSEAMFREFETELSITPKISPEETKQLIVNNILNSVYSSTRQTPTIIFLGRVDGRYSFKLKASVMNEDYFNRLLFSLTNKFEQ